MELEDRDFTSPECCCENCKHCRSYLHCNPEGSADKAALMFFCFVDKEAELFDQKTAEEIDNVMADSLSITSEDDPSFYDDDFLELMKLSKTDNSIIDSPRSVYYCEKCQCYQPSDKK